MSLTTFSVFYYGFNVTNDNRFLSFSEGAGELIADVEVGDWTATELTVKIKSALDLAGTQVYSVVFNRNDRTFSISAANPFSLLVATGTSGATIFPTMGFTGPDRTGLLTYTGNTQAGDAYEPQFILQDYVSGDNNQRLVNPAINKSANGRVEVVRFGVERIIRMNVRFATNIPQDGRVIKSNPTGVEDLSRFLRFAMQKIPFEFMPDINDRDVFVSAILESFPGTQNGTGFQLTELYGQGLPGYFDTGIFELREIEVI